MLTFLQVMIQVHRLSSRAQTTLNRIFAMAGIRTENTSLLPALQLQIGYGTGHCIQGASLYGPIFRKQDSMAFYGCTLLHCSYLDPPFKSF